MISKKGFTLIELLIVIAIIGVLAVAFLPNLMGAPSKARDTQRMSEVQKIAAYLTEYSLTGQTITGGCVAAGENGMKASDFGGKIPVDPSGATYKNGDCNGQYLVVTDNDGPYTFGVFATVENEENGNASACPTVEGTGDDFGTDVTIANSGSCFAVLIK